MQLRRHKLVSALATAVLCANCALTFGAAHKTHTVFLGAIKRVAYSKVGDPAGAAAGETELKIRALLVDGQLKEWTTGESHDVTDRSFVVRRALRLNDALPGENPAAADAAGISVQKFRFWYVAAGSSLAAGAGAYLTLAFVPSWSEGVVAGRGWIAVALVIFAGYRPINAVLAALLFGAIPSLGFVGQARNWPIAAPILSMLPYLGTIALIIMPVLAWHRVRRLMAAPAALGEPYYRDVR